MKTKKLLALVLCLALAVSIVSPATVVLAADDPYHVEDDTEIIGGGGNGGGGSSDNGDSGDSYHTGNDTYVIRPDVEPIELVYEKVMAMETEEALNEYLLSLSQEQLSKVLQLLTEEDIRTLAARFSVTLEEEVVTPAKDYTEVGPLMPAVETEVRMSRMAFRSADMLTGENENENPAGLELDKRAEALDNGQYQIILEAYTTGSVTVSDQAVPTDIVLILDESGSMKNSIYGYSKTYSLDSSKDYYVKREDSFVKVSFCRGGLLGSHEDGWFTGGHFLIHWGSEYEPMTSQDDSTAGHVQFYTRSETESSKREALINAAKIFVKKVYDNATLYNVDHRISVIGFADNSSIKIGLADDIRNNKTAVDTAIDNLNAADGTYIEKGMSDAKSVYDNAAPSSASTRNRVVVVFTDGIPGSGTWNNETIKYSANPAISTAKDLKTTYGATLYTIGMLDDADPELEISNENNNMARTNKFLHYLSSNYPNASSMSNGGKGSNQGYYLSASDSESLEKIFEKISQEIEVPTIELGAGAIIRDAISQYFVLPSDFDESDVILKTMDADYSAGHLDWNNETEINGSIEVSGDQIAVSGFNFNENFVSETARENGFHGKKLIITFVVETAEGFFGGNNVPTNSKAQLYPNDSAAAIGTFPVPTVNVPINYEMAVKHQTIYLGNSADLKELLDYAKDYKPDGRFNNDYVDIAYTLKQGETTIGTYTISNGQSAQSGSWSTGDGYAPKLTDCTEGYTLSCTVTPSEDAAQDGVSDWNDKKEAAVHVMVPKLTFNDVWVDYDVTFNLAEYCQAKMDDAGDWVDNDHAGIPTPIGSLPTVGDCAVKVVGTTDGALEDSKGFTTGEQDTAFLVTGVEINGTSYPYKTIFGDAEREKDFTVHINHFDLKLDKILAHNNAAFTQDFIFTVKDENGEGFQLAIGKDSFKDGNGASRTIKNLVCGKTYTVTEDKNWAWRYDLISGNNKTVTCTNEGISKIAIPVGTENVRFTNKLVEQNWLDDSYIVENKFGRKKSRSAKEGRG